MSSTGMASDVGGIFADIKSVSNSCDDDPRMTLPLLQPRRP